VTTRIETFASETCCLLTVLPETVRSFGRTLLQMQSVSNYIRQRLSTRLIRLCYRAQLKPELMSFTNSQTQKRTSCEKKVVSDSKSTYQS